MKFNSKICTSKEQSERLLALGLKRETADMHYHCIVCNESPEYVLTFNNPKIPLDTPAWSLNRLIEIYEKTCIFWTDCFDNPYDAMISRIANKIKSGELNKEYLEE